jgi:hypothetical protein
MAGSRRRAVALGMELRVDRLELLQRVVGGGFDGRGVGGEAAQRACRRPGECPRGRAEGPPENHGGRGGCSWHVSRQHASWRAGAEQAEQAGRRRPACARLVVFKMFEGSPLAAAKARSLRGPSASERAKMNDRMTMTAAPLAAPSCVCV